jgi:cysteine desulfurase/selenocysteine lyase
MIRKVTLEKTTWADVPGKFEAGTPSVGDVVAFGEALSYLAALGMDRVHDFEVGMTDYLLEQLATVNGLNVVGPATNTDRSAVISFTLNDVHPHDVAAILDEDNVAVRAGHHCAQPLLHALGVHSTTRASIYVYNTHEDIDRLVASLSRAYKIFH